MTTNEILQQWVIQGATEVFPIKVVRTGTFASNQSVYNDAVRIGNNAGADYIIGFQIQTVAADSRRGRGWRGYGVAVKTKPGSL